MTDEDWMRQAIDLAHKAEQTGEVPVGAIIVHENNIVGEGWNQPIQQHDPSAHAEVIAIRQAGLNQQNYRLPNTTLYVTLEPCSMCSGLMIHARVKRVVFGAYDPKTGAAGSMFDTLINQNHNHHIEVHGGILEDECSNLLRSFFQRKRKKSKT